MSILSIRDVSKQYAHHRALDHIGFDIPAGSVFGLLGPNGAGKTSLIRIITQITGPDSGQVLFEGEPLHPDHIYKIGYLPEERGLYKKMEVGEQLLYFARLKGLSQQQARAEVKQWVDRFEIGNWWHKKVEELSKGMQQKIQFIATVLHKPTLIILDEPFSGFDPINANLIRDEILRLNKEGATIIFSTHRMETVEQLCDHIALINKSKLVLEGEIQEVRNRFRTHVFELEHSPADLRLPAGYVLQEKENIHDGLMRTRLVIEQGNTNDLLSHVLPQARILGLRELIPGMNEIFIMAVNHENLSTR